jgi:Tetracyclin repressor-like, C-terminal domain/Bacterial regulatory proteins, tetR family
MSRLMPRRTPTQDRSRQRVAEIIAAAFSLIREGGIERCTMAALAARAELSEETLDGLHATLVENLTAVESEVAARSAIRQTLVGYHRAFTEDRALRELWTGTFASPDLVSLNIADSRRNSELIADLVAPWSRLDRDVLATRAFLLAHLTGASIALILESEPEEAARLLLETGALIDSLFG